MNLLRMMEKIKIVAEQCGDDGGRRSERIRGYKAAGNANVEAGQGRVRKNVPDKTNVASGYQLFRRGRR
jgi:hypothetical protein